MKPIRLRRGEFWMLVVGSGLIGANLLLVLLISTGRVDRPLPGPVLGGMAMLLLVVSSVQVARRREREQHADPAVTQEIRGCGTTDRRR